MKLNELESKLASREIKKGAYTAITWQSNVPLRASATGSTNVRKVTQGVGRIGVNYGHIAKIREQGIVPGPLPYGQWQPGKENIVIDHNGAYQLRIAKTGNGHQYPKVVYLQDGQEISKEALMATGIVLPSYWSGEKDNLIFNVKLENVLHIGKRGE